MSDKVLYEKDGQIVTITLNDPAMRKRLMPSSARWSV